MTAQPDTATDFIALHSAICATIRAAFPVFQTVEAYRPDRKNLPVPACLIELIDMEPLPDEDPGTEQIAVQANFEARIILGRRSANLHLEVRRLAAAMARLTRDQRWGLKVGAAYPTAIEPDAFEPDLDQFEVWRVEWAQTLHIGESVWNDDGTIPHEVLMSYAPDIGPDHETDYRPVTA